MIKIKLSKYCKSGSGGGPRIFVSRLFNYLQEAGKVKIVESKHDLYFSTVSPGDIGEVSGPTVYRAASCYYDTNVKRTFGLNKKMKKAIKRATYVIYQTKFAHKLCNGVIGKRKHNLEFISNGFDRDKYEDIEAYNSEYEHVFVAYSKWTKAKRLKLIVQSFLKAKIENSCLLVIGESKKHTDKKNVIYLGNLRFEDVVPYLKGRYYFVHLCLADICPNVVVEALSFGCPVICSNVGGAQELVQEDGLVANCDRNFVYKRRPQKVKTSLKPIIRCLRNVIKQEWNVSRADLGMDICAERYMQVFKKCLI